MFGGVFTQIFNKPDVSKRCVDVIDTWILLKSKHRFFSVKNDVFSTSMNIKHIYRW